MIPLLLFLSALPWIATAHDNEDINHIEVPHSLGEEFLANLLPSLNDDVQSGRRRRLAQQWTQFNNYFSGDSTKPNPQNLPTYYGQIPGPCPLASAGHTDKCFVRVCDMNPIIRAQIVCVPILGCDQVQNWINCDDCNNYPGDTWIYDVDAGNLRMGGIYLDIKPQTANTDDVAPTSAPFTSDPRYDSEAKFWNQFRMEFTLSEVQLDADLRVDIERLRLKKPLGFTLSKHQVGVTLRKSSQTIDGSNHGISFRSILIFRANKACIAANPANPTVQPSAFDTTCIYRSDYVNATTRSLKYRSPRTETFAQGILYDINLPREGGNNENPTAAYDASSCQWDFANQYSASNPGATHNLDLGLTLDLGPLCPIFGTDVCRSILNAIVNWIIVGILKGILCDLFNELFFQSNGASRNPLPTATPGLINVGVRNLYKFFKKYVEDPLSTQQDAELAEDVTFPNKFAADGYVWPRTNCAKTSYCPHPDAINFNTSGIFKSVSLGLNGLLGNLSTTPGYTDKLVIVEVIDILTGNKNGTVPIGICPPGLVETCTLGYCAGTCDGDIKSELQLSDYPRFTWSNQPVFNGKIQLNGILLTGVNSITQLNILDNGFSDALDTTPTYTHTVMNTFRMKKFGIEFYLTLTLTDGSWVHRPRYQVVPASQIRSINMQTNVFIEISNILAKIDVMLLLDATRLSDKYVGSVFGNWPSGNFTKRLHCAAYALELVQIPRLQLAGYLSQLNFTNFLGDLSSVILQGTQVFDKAYRPATALFLPFLADNWVRPTLNSYLLNNTYDGPCGTRSASLPRTGANTNCTRPKSLDKCDRAYPYYFAPTDINRYINFYNSKAWNALKGVVNDVVGGIPVRTGSASINSIIDTYLEWYVPVAKKNNITVTKVGNVPGTHPTYTGREMGNMDFPFNAIEIRSRVEPNKRYFTLSRFQVRNIETIHELSLFPSSQANPRDFTVFFKLGGGKIWDRTNNRYILNGAFYAKFHLATNVNVNVEGVPTTYAADEADFAFEFTNITFSSTIYALLNQNDMLDLRFGDLTKLGCILSLLDDFEVKTLLLGFQSFNFNVGRIEDWRGRTAGTCNPNPGWNVDSNNPVFTSSINMGVTPCTPGVIVRFSDALDYLDWEANFWGAKVKSMLTYIFNGVSKQAKNAANAFTAFNPPTVGCENYLVGTGGTLAKILSLTKNASSEGKAADTFWTKLTTNQVNPRFPEYPKGTCGLGGSTTCQINYGNAGEVATQIGLPAFYDPINDQVGCVGKPNADKPGACWEEKVVDDDNRVDMRDNFIVKEVQKFIKKSGQKVVIDGLNALASTSGNPLLDTIVSYKNGTMLPDGRGPCVNTINGLASYCIDIDINTTALGIPYLNDSTFIPGLIVQVKRIQILNLHTFDADPESFNLLFNYIPDQYRPDLFSSEYKPQFTHSRYTLAHRIKFGETAAYLKVIMDMEFTVAQEFLNVTTTTPSKPITDAMRLSFQFKNFDFQLMTTTAFNASRILEVPFTYFLDPLNPERCLYSIFYKNGLYLPQFQLNIGDLIGPEVTITPVTNPGSGVANIFSKGIGYLITSTIEILFQLIKEDIPDITQGAVRDYLNRVLDQIVVSARNAIGPGSCPQPAVCGPPNSMCHYQQFNANSFAKVLEIVNTVVGGNPVKTSLLDVNSVVDLGLNYALLDPNGPLLLGSGTNKVTHPDKGTWFIASVLDYINGQSFVKIQNVGIKGLDSIYKLQLGVYNTAPYDLGLTLELGNGTMLNGSLITPAPFQAEPFTIQLELDLKVVAQRPQPSGAPVPETLADNAFRVELRFAGLNLSTVQQVLANRTDFFTLSISQVSKTQCILAFIDKVTLEQFSVHLSDFDVYLPMPGSGPNQYGRNPDVCGSGANTQCHLGTAIDILRSEAALTNAYAPPAQSKPLSMMNVVLGNIGDTVKRAVNSATFFNDTLYKCEVPKVVFQIITGVYTKNDSDTLIKHLLRNVTGILSNPYPEITSDFASLTVQSTRASKPATKQAFIDEVIRSAYFAKGQGTKVQPVILEVGSFCDTLGLSAALTPICTAVLGNGNVASNLTQTLNRWVNSGQTNLIENKVPPSFIEAGVAVDTTRDQYYDIRTSSIVAAVTKYFDKSVSTLELLLKTAANDSSYLITETDGTVSFKANLTTLMLLVDEKVFLGKTCEGEQKVATFLFADLLGTTNVLLPNLRFVPGNLYIRNFGSFSEITVFRPYSVGPNPEDKARFTTQNQFGWRKDGFPMNISVGIDMFYDYGFTHPSTPLNTGAEEKESITINLILEDLLIQILALLAVDTRELGQVRLGDFLNVDPDQKFRRNCKAVTCLMTGIFDGGLQIPQLSVNVTDIKGPTFRTTRKLFSPGMEAFIDALLELGAQLFRDDLTSLSQGPLRNYINQKLTKTLGDAKAPGACPPRRNYTDDYPLGQFYCSHNDTKGMSALLTQNEKACVSKGRSLNGPTCRWSNPDVATLTPQTVACFYTKASKDLNFQRAAALTDLQNFVNKSLLNRDSSFYINDFLGVVASNLKTKMYQIDGFPLKYNGNEYGTATIGVGEFGVRGLDTVDRLQVFDSRPYAPGGEFAFKNGPEYEGSGVFNMSRGRRLAVDVSDFGYQDNKYTTRTAIGFTGPLILSMRLLLVFDELFVPTVDSNPDGKVVNDITLSITLRDFDFAIDLYMLVNIPRLMDLQVRSIGTIYELPCILEIFEDNGLVPVHLNITYGSVGFEFCANKGPGALGRTDSPMFQALQLACFNDQTSNDLARTFTKQFQKITNYLIKAAASSGLQDYLNTQVASSNVQCEAIKAGDLALPDYGTDTSEQEDAAAGFGIAGLVMIFVWFVGMALLVPVHFKRRDDLMKRALLQAHERGTAGKSKDEFELAERRLKSAFLHPVMPLPVKFGVPFWIFINIVMFATANFAAPGAIVELKLSVAGSETYPITLLPFTLASSINDMWNAGVYPLAVIIALASGGWPYAKQILLLFCWFAPSTVLHPHARGRMLEILDSLGKWSLIDIYVLVMLMVAFRFYLTSSMLESLTLLPPNVITVDVTVTPGWGIFGFTFGAIGSLLVNHLMIWYHRKVIRSDEDFEDAILGTLVKDLRTPRIPLSKHRFNILDAEGRPYHYSAFSRIFVVFLLAICFVLYIVGSVVPAIIFTFRGIAGLAIAVINPALSVNTQSVASIGTSIIQGARPDTASVLGIIFLQILYIMFALVIPLLLCVVLLVIWLVPLTLREQLLLYFLAEVLSAWEAGLVLFVSLVAAVLQISQLAQFIVDHATAGICSGIQGQLQKVFPDPMDAKCFDVIAELASTVSLYGAASFGLLLFGGVAFRLIHAAVNDRELAMRRKPAESPGAMTGCQGFYVRRALEAFGVSQIDAGAQGGVANMYAQNQGAFQSTSLAIPSMSNPVMKSEFSSMNAQEKFGGHESTNPKFNAGGAHFSGGIDV